MTKKVSNRVSFSSPFNSPHYNKKLYIIKPLFLSEAGEQGLYFVAPYDFFDFFPDNARISVYFGFVFAENYTIIS
jgi:hypothetical protein